MLRVPLLPRAVALLLALSALASAGDPPALRSQAGTAPRRPDNVLVILADDMGVDRTPAYGPDAVGNGPTPVLDLLARHGVLFRNAYAEPLCSPTRASTLTGKHPFRTGIGKGVSWNGANGIHEVDPAELTLPEALAATHRTFAIGKWHLAHREEIGGSGYQHPVLFGFDEHHGPIGNLPLLGLDYTDYEKNDADANGNVQTMVRGTYATSDQVDDALDAIERAGDEPWFVWLAFNAPHTPYHVPPDHLTTLPVDAASPNDIKHRAMIEAMDTEIGRLLTSVRPAVLARTWIVFMGDNGSPGGALPGVSQAKGGVGERGVHVPLIVLGPDVAAPGREVDALVGCTDLYATICELVGRGIPPVALDSISFADQLRHVGAPPRRRRVFAETFEPNGLGVPRDAHRRTLRGARWKLTRVENLVAGTLQDELFDLEHDPLATKDELEDPTPEELDVYADLVAELLTLQ